MSNDDETSPPPSSDTTLVNTPRPSTPQNNVTSTVEDMASKTIDKVEKAVLYAFDEAPTYQQDNHFILSGYRGELKSFKRCFNSIFSLHNETGTISVWDLVDCTSEYLVSSIGGVGIRSAGGIRVVYLFTTISDVVTCRHCCFRVLFWWSGDLSWNECECTPYILLRRVDRF